MHISQPELADTLQQARQQVTIGGRYAHYKNPDNIYKVLAIAITEADETPCVVYQAEYGEQLTFVRPLTSWLEQIEHAGELVPRFAKAG